MSSEEFAVVVQDWPRPGTGNEGPLLLFGRGPAKLAYDTADDKVAIVTIPLCLQAICGHPNDEVLSGHTLYGKGLEYYSVHRVQNSSRLDAMEKTNSVHPRHNAAAYLNGKEHWVFTFQDATVEIIALSIDSPALSFRLCNSWAEANTQFAVSEA